MTVEKPFIYNTWDVGSKWNVDLDRGFHSDKNGPAYPFKIKVGRLTLSNKSEEVIWCKENCIGKFHRDRSLEDADKDRFETSNSISFELEEDAALFKMTW